MAFLSTRTKRVSDPLNERVKAHLLHTTSHPTNSSDLDEDHSIFPNQIHNFFDLDNNNNGDEYSTTSDSDSTPNEALDTLKALLKPSKRSCALHADVLRVADNDRSSLQFVAARLREKGYDAGLCRTKWDNSGGQIAGSYEYIDVVLDGEERYIVDLEFRGQFEVARGTEEYEKVVEAVPKVVVGREEEVRKAVKVVVEAGKRSMRRRGMGVPPWRRRRYVLSKWFGEYRRTVSFPLVGLENSKCRSGGGVWGEEERRKWSVVS